MNKAEILVKPIGMKMYYSETPRVRNIINIVLGTEFDLTIAQYQIKGGKITYPKRRYHLASIQTS
jgi:hypothetical protein